MKLFQCTDLTCPDCRGPISTGSKGVVKEYRCRVAHRYSPEAYLAAQAETTGMHPLGGHHRVGRGRRSGARRGRGRYTGSQIAI